ncbi:hypothetical protein NA8A_20717 [Nitratireductor indicus C115]|uniref:Type II toxin-antitoxin system RelE/ParE family toxin n=1 Tax=Nitratireductor indicus C115 TaxID=1231190 RepID=K2NLM5_9HYPH|nr:type II toxin-antitoxin system RelE/ParE family toxin [Nitratireductor indicus]EKF40360.1 hypothetical protein NA8A_20717 [Nitratireductor indicus C115]SFQ77702.1 hypothetical protein SAMN05216176_114122 [Nitratireductor indicus]
MRIYRNAWFGRFARKERIADAALLDAVRRAERGQIDADLGGGVIKQRVARAGQGRSGGYRTIVLYRRGQRSFFVFGFAKSGRDNIADDEEEQFRRMAGHVLALSDAHLAALVEAGQFVEIEGYDDEEI